MPYVTLAEKQIVFAETAGQLNYQITCKLLDYLATKGERYQTYCDIEGVLSHASKEMYRRKTAAYEDKKILENGDIF